MTRDEKWRRAVAAGEQDRDGQIDDLISHARRLARELTDTLERAQADLRRATGGDDDE